LLYAAKIAAAELYAPEHVRAAIIAALRVEQRAVLRALRERHQLQAERRRRKKLVWTIVARGNTASRSRHDPSRPPSRLIKHRRRERQNDQER